MCSCDFMCSIFAKIPSSRGTGRGDPPESTTRRLASPPPDAARFAPKTTPQRRNARSTRPPPGSEGVSRLRPSRSLRGGSAGFVGWGPRSQNLRQGGFRRPERVRRFGGSDWVRGPCVVWSKALPSNLEQSHQGSLGARHFVGGILITGEWCLFMMLLEGSAMQVVPDSPFASKHPKSKHNIIPAPKSGGW